MNRIIPLSLIAVASIYAAEVKLAPISVESTMITEVSKKAQTSADLAQTLSTAVPSIDMSRRSGIANDIYIRGQKRDNISIEVDGTKVCGACPNRMDPPTSHILASQIDNVEVIEGPYDVETFGTMSGGIKVTTKKPTKKLQGEVNFGLGSWAYNKIGFTTSAGTDLVRVLVSASSESSDQYEDGDGNTMSEQTKLNAPLPNQYQPQYENMKAYKKKSIMAKAFVSTAENQELRLSATANRSDNVLYPNTPMDAISDDSNIYSIAYNVDNLSDAYRNINLQYYYSEVDHPMSTQYRNAPLMNPAMDTTNHMNSTMQGAKLKNTLELNGHKILLGLDGSKRMWKGEYLKTTTGAVKGTSIAQTNTDNIALFAKVEKSYRAFDVSIGARYDSTVIKSDDVTADSDRNFNAINANIFTSYNLDKENRIFFGIGQASRVPDARELYFRKGPTIYGTPDLQQTTNQQADLGYELKSELFDFKIKAFYSMLQDYIYLQKSAANVANKFKNIDASVYGAELTASVYATDELTVDLGASYKRGTKDEALAGQDDTDLADMAPLRGNIALNYEYANNSLATLEVVASDKWSNFDEDNGEQELAAWSIVNLKVKHAFNKHFDFTLGVNNLFDETYAQSNTYADLTLLSAGGTDIMLMNEPGQYIYTNLDFKF